MRSGEDWGARHIMDELVCEFEARLPRVPRRSSTLTTYLLAVSCEFSPADRVDYVLTAINR